MAHRAMAMTGCAGHCPSGELGGAAEGTVVNPDLAIVAGDDGPDDGKSEPLDGALDYQSLFQDGAGTVIAFVPVSDVAVEPRCPPPTLRSWCTKGRSTTSTRPTVRWAPTPRRRVGDIRRSASGRSPGGAPGMAARSDRPRAAASGHPPSAAAPVPSRPPCSLPRRPCLHGTGQVDRC